MPEKHNPKLNSTCLGCNAKSTLAWWCGKSLCSHVGLDHLGPAAAAVQPVCPALNSQLSWSGGTGWWLRTKPHLEAKKYKKLINMFLFLTHSVQQTIIQCTWAGSVTCVIHDVKEFTLRETSSTVPSVLTDIFRFTAWWLPSFPQE